MEDSKLPLGICKQAVMKLESAMADLNEIAQDDEVNDSDKELFESLGETVGNVMAVVTTKVMNEMEEDEFLREEINMDEIDHFPEEVRDLLDEEIE